MELSIIVPISDMAGKLDLLKEWLKETYSEYIEVFLIHDKKDEGTSIELKNLERSIKKLNINASLFFLECEVNSPGLARNVGLQKAKGKWIIFWDSDDKPNFAAVMRNLRILDQDNDIYIFDFNNQTVIPNKTTNNFCNNSLKTMAQSPGIWRFIFSNNFLSDIKFDNLKMAEDQVFICELLSRSPKVSFMAEFIYTYITGNEGQLTNNSKAKEDIFIAITKIIDLLKKNEITNREVIFVMLLKLIYSNMKYNKNSSAIKSLIRFLYWLSISKFANKIAFIKALTYLVNEHL